MAERQFPVTQLSSYDYFDGTANIAIDDYGNNQ